MPRQVRIRVIEIQNVPASKTLFGSPSNLTLVVKLDGAKRWNSAPFTSSPCIRLDTLTEYTLDSENPRFDFEVRRAGILGYSGIFVACSLQASALQGLQPLPLYAADGTGAAVGTLVVETSWDAPVQGLVANGLINRASSRSGSYLDPGDQAPKGLVQYPSPNVGLANRASTGSIASSGSIAASGSMSVPTGTRPSVCVAQATAGDGTAGGKIANHSGESSSLVSDVTAASAPGGLSNRAPLLRRGSTGLINMAESSSDGTRPNAVPRAKELLDEFDESVDAGCEQHWQKLQQILENLRHAPQSDLRDSEGQAVVEHCKARIRDMFNSALKRGVDKELQSALWLAGRLPASSDDDATHEKETLQDVLRRRWDAVKMEEAYTIAEVLLVEAASNAEQLENLIDSVDIAEFHGFKADVKFSHRSDALFAQLKPGVCSWLRRLLREEHFKEVEDVLGIIGNARISALGVQDLQKELELKKGLDLLSDALLPFAGQVGFPGLKRRQLRHAVMNVQAAMRDNPAKAAAHSLRQHLLSKLLLACMDHSEDSTTVALGTAFDLNLPDTEVWSAAEGKFHASDNAHQAKLASWLPAACKTIHQKIPPWLLDTLKTMYRLPEDWDVASMAKAENRLLAKSPVTDRRILDLFRDILTKTIQAHVRTRDRRGGAPQKYSVKRAVQVMNATNWQTYVQRRDEIRQECKRLKVPYDDEHWQDNLNGPIMSMFIKDAIQAAGQPEPLVHEANEMWLLHGTTHAAADGITTDDFDMTRANPMGLFGGGIYFGESISKADEYAEGLVEDREEIFPLLLCRVTLGYVYYCDERRPDKSKLVDRCITNKWHSVLGDRLKTSKTFREFIVYDNVQAFPAYIIYYSRHY